MVYNDCLKFFHKSLFFIVLKDLRSCLKQETSLIISTLFLIEKSIIKEFLVSMDNKVFGKFFLNFSTIFFILLNSWLWEIIFDPRRVDSPPISIMFAPELNKFIACLIPLFFLLNFPPSEKLSGVRFKIPRILGIELN